MQRHPADIHSSEEEKASTVHVHLTDLDLAGAGKTASTAAGSKATAARAVLPGPTSRSSGFTPKISGAASF